MKQRVISNNFTELDYLYATFRQNFKGIEKWSFQILHPCTISPNALTTRFQMIASEDHQSFIFVHLPIHEQLFSQMQPIIQNSYGKYYFEGPQGIGKSFALLNMVLNTRMQTDKYRVIYVNNPGLWMQSLSDYIINEMIWAFMDDQNSFPPYDPASLENPLRQWDIKLRNSKNKQEDFEKFLFTARVFCERRKLKFISFMDEENLIEIKRNQNGPCCLNHFPWNIYQEISQVSVVISFASSNNQTKIERTSEWKNLATELEISFQDFGFPIEIAELIVKRFLLTQGIEDYGLAQQILSLTGRNPYEIAVLLKYCSKHQASTKDIKNFKEHIYLCWTYRCQELLDSHGHFRDAHLKELDSERKFLRAASYTDADLEAPKEVLEFYDKTLMYQSHGKLWSLSPIAKGILSSDLEYQTDIIEDLVLDHLRQNLKGQGEVFQRYILHSMTKIKNERKTLTLKYKDIRSKSTGQKALNIKEIEVLVTTPLQKPAITTLYIPLSRNSLNVDCLIYDQPENTLYPIQITLTQKNHKDSFHSWQAQAEKAEKEWLNIFQGSQVQFVWMVGSPKKDVKESENYWEVTFASLSETNGSFFHCFEQQKDKIQLKLRELDDATIYIE